MQRSRHKQPRAKGERKIRSTPARLGLKGRGLKRHWDDDGNEMEWNFSWPCRIYAAEDMRSFQGRKSSVKNVSSM